VGLLAKKRFPSIRTGQHSIIMFKAFTQFWRYSQHAKRYDTGFSMSLTLMANGINAFLLNKKAYIGASIIALRIGYVLDKIFVNVLNARHIESNQIVLKCQLISTKQVKSPRFP